MAVTAAAQQNNANTRGIYFIGIDRRFCAPSFKTTASSLFQNGYLSVTAKIDEDGNLINVSTRGEIKQQLGISPATISRNNKRLKDSGVFDKQGNTYVYRNDISDGAQTKKWYCPTEILTESFKAEDDNGNTFDVKFTYCEGLVYAYYYTLLPHKGRNQRTIEATFDEVAEALGIDSSTVSDAVRKLRMAELIYFPSGWTGKNRYKKSKVGLRRGFSWFKREREYNKLLEKKKENKAPSKPKQKAPEDAVNAAVTRQGYYSGLQAAAEKKARQALEKALKSKGFRRLQEDLSDVKYRYNNSIIHNNIESQKELSAAIARLNNRISFELKNIGIDPEELKPEHYVKCVECQDTGVKIDGSACNCFKRSRGAPGNGKKNVVGEQNTKN